MLDAKIVLFQASKLHGVFTGIFFNQTFFSCPINKSCQSLWIIIDGRIKNSFPESRFLTAFVLIYIPINFILLREAFASEGIQNFNYELIVPSFNCYLQKFSTSNLRNNFSEEMLR